VKIKLRIKPLSPDSLNPDPAFQVNPDPNILSFLNQKIAVYLSLVQLQENPSALKQEHPVLKKMKFINSFLILRVIFFLLDPDPDRGTPLNPGSGSKTLQKWTQIRIPHN
jgi:hypothetical protein